MKYKHVFLIWLLADVFLALVLLLLVIWNAVAGVDKDFDGLFLLVIAYGVVISLPSLVLLTIFHFVYNGRLKKPKTDTKPYIAVIVGINVLYLFSTFLTGIMDAEFNFFYLCSTAAGLLAFYTVNRKARKALAVHQAEEEKAVP